MRKFVIIFALMAMEAGALAQTVTLRFTGRTLNSHYKRLSGVKVTNLTHNWEQIITYPDTVFQIYAMVGIEENTDIEAEVSVMPNPFNGQAAVGLDLKSGENIRLHIYDINGKCYANYEQALEAGSHCFDISLSTPGTYFLIAQTTAGNHTVKMVNIGDGGSNSIAHRSNIPMTGTTLKTYSSHPFHVGDVMQYLGYASSGSETVESYPITQRQYGDEDITLYFDIDAKPTVQTKEVDNVTATAAICGGEILSDGGAAVTARGVCWSTSQTPTIANAHTTNGSGTGSFTSIITGLAAGTTYYVRAYATNSVGTSYGVQRRFTTLDLPTITTNTVSNITTSTATCGGYVTAAGGAAVTARGVCWSTSQTPTIANAHTTNGSGTGSFTSSITGLAAGTTYYVRAYATNSVGTSYGVQRSFTTLAVATCPSTITDHQGNVYNTVRIGTQCWMAENMRCTTSPTGKSWSNQPTSSTYTPFYAHGTGTENGWSYNEYYYNWVAAIDYMPEADTAYNYLPDYPCRGICPQGWHIPTDAEWTVLTNYVGDNYGCNGNSSNAAKALASQTGWSSSTATCAVGNTPSSNNATGFGAVPAGYYLNSVFYNRGIGTYSWSTFQYSSNKAHSSRLNYANASVGMNVCAKYAALSVRCLKDN